MPPALVTDVGVVAIGAGPVITAVPAGAGSTFSVRNFPFTSSAWLLDLAFKGPHAGMIRVRSPKFADNVQGIRVNVPTGIQGFLLDPASPEFLIPQDTLIVELNGTAADPDGALLQSYYDNLSGAEPVLKMPGDISSQMQWEDSWVVGTTASATIGTILSTPITTTYDVSQANRWYAVLGYVTDVALLGVGVTGADQSFLNVMGPGDTTPFRTRRYFTELSYRTGKPCIPCFNTANKGNTGVVTADTIASTTANVTLIVAIMPALWTP
jgi:hypothetical protein